MLDALERGKERLPGPRDYRDYDWKCSSAAFWGGNSYAPRSSPFIGSVRLIHIPANRSRSARRSGSLMPSASDKHSHALSRYPDDRYCVRRSPSSASLTQYWDKFSIDALVWVLGVASANFRQSQATRLYSSAVLMGCVSPFAHEPRVSLGATAHEPRPFRLGIENCIPADTS